jgi:hypothetical protein
MPLKCLNPDGIRPLAGCPQSSVLVCSVHNKSSLLNKVPIRSRLISEIFDRQVLRKCQSQKISWCRLEDGAPRHNRGKLKGPGYRLLRATPKVYDDTFYIFLADS